MTENDLTETTRKENRRHRDHVGPTAEQYMAAHPEVDWSTHEVLYSVIEIDSDSGVIVTEIRDHWVKPDYEALYAAIREQDEFERVLLRTPKADQVVLKAGFFRQLYTAQAKLWALEAEGVDNWEGFAPAMAQALGDEWVKEMTRDEE